MFDLDGKIALVTGGSRGIGRAIAIGLAKAGAQVIVNYVSNQQAARDTVETILAAGGRAEEYRANVTDESAVESMFAWVDKQFGRLDILVNNAAVLSRYPFLEMPAEEWIRIMNGNVNGYFYCGQRAARMMVRAGWGRIINISSCSQVQAAPNRSHYCTSKAAIGMLTKCMALEMAPHNVTVNCVMPGTIATDFNADVLADPEYRKNAVSLIPSGKIGRPEDVVAAVLMLASEEASYCTGSMIAVDGGITLK